MKTHVLERLQRIPQWLRNKYAPGALILLYHRVADTSLDPHLLSVTPRHFAEHLDVLRKHYRPMSLQQLAQALRERKSIGRVVVVTFDDGYADNLYNAKPLLERFDIPATVFVPTESVGQVFEAWRGELERVLLRPGTLPKILSLSVDGKTQHWDLGESALYTDEVYKDHRGWNFFAEIDPSPRHSLYRALYLLLRPMPEDKQQDVLDQVLAWANLEPIRDSPHRSLSPAEVFRLAKDGLVEIGSHAMTHTPLVALSASAQREEIQRSKNDLEEMSGRPVVSFAYPFGLPTDYNEDAVALVKEAGYKCACAATTGVVGPSADTYQLQRLTVGNPHTMTGEWDGEAFAGVMRWMIGK